MSLIFVYGTLKERYWNNSVLGDSKRVCKAYTKDKYLLTNCGFPYLIPQEALSGPVRGSTLQVLGEVYEVTSEKVMASLDILEGVRVNHYKHHKTVVIGDDGEELEVTAYVAGDPEIAEQFTPCETNEGKYEWA